MLHCDNRCCKHPQHPYSHTNLARSCGALEPPKTAALGCKGEIPCAGQSARHKLHAVGVSQASVSQRSMLIARRIAKGEVR